MNKISLCRFTWFKLVTASLLLVLFTGCSSSNQNRIIINEKSVTFEECEVNEVTVVTSSKNHIIVKYRESDRDAAQTLATYWCEKTNREASESRNSCSGCCKSSYQCR